MQRLFVTAAAAIVLLTACASSIPVSGRMERTNETFEGSIANSGRRGATGELTLVSNRKSTCRGTFVNTSARRGEGVLNCDDGRTGNFRLAGTGKVGTGSGELSGQRFTFTFDDRD